MQYHRRY